MTPERLDAASGKAASAAPARRLHRRACLECGEPYASPAARSEFCSPKCRGAWNNRRAVRGAEIYDLIMAWRFDRPAARALGVWRLVCRMAAAFRRADGIDRSGRRSWREAAEVIAERPWLSATAMGRTAGGRGRRP